MAATDKLRWIIYMLRIRRVEFRIAEIPIVLVPIFLLMRDTAVLKTFAFWEGIFLFFLLFAFGDMINCLADRDLDAVYKPHLSEAVYGLGVGFVTFQVIASAIVALAISLHLSWVLNRWILFPLVAVGLLLGTAYSVKPVQLKGRGLAQLICLWLIIFVGPMIFVGLLINETPSLTVLIFAAGFGMVQMGVILVNTAEDYPEDLEANIKTTIVSLGLHRGIALAFWLTIVGAVFVTAALCILFFQHAANPLWMIAVLPFVIASRFVISDIAKLKNSIANSTLEESIQKVKHSAKRVPLWITIIAWSALATTFVYMMTKATRL